MVTSKRLRVNDSRREYYVADLIIKNTRFINGSPKDTYIPLEAWDKMCERACQFQTGDLVYVTGRFVNKNWRDRNGEDCTKNVISVESIELYEPKKYDNN